MPVNRVLVIEVVVAEVSYVLVVGRFVVHNDKVRKTRTVEAN